MKTFGWIIILALIVVAAIAVIPLILLAGLNLLGYNVGYSFDAWLGAFLIQLFIGTVTSGSTRSTKK
jgi:hypothetical protein